MTGWVLAPSVAHAQLDHYKCYQGKDLKNPKFIKTTAATSDQLVPNEIVTVQKVKFVCNPVSKNGSTINDPSARGAFVGLRLDHDRGHLFRAVLEATAYGFRHHLDVFAELGRAPSRIRVTNGGARSRLWKQVVADVLGHPLESLTGSAGSELGAAFAAGMGVGGFSSWSDIARYVTVGDVVEPDSAAHGAYDDLYAAYRALYPALDPVLALTRHA